VKPGTKIKFTAETQRYTVRACNERYWVCNKPFNLKKTVLYTVVDLVRGVRGTENLIFGFGAETKKQCEQMLDRLVRGESEVSYRNVIPLDIERIDE